MEYWKREVYKNPLWYKCRQAVIKRDRDICYFCNKIILKRRTIHHIIELDEHNYSDVNIAFNLDNLVECHNKCHDEYHERWSNNQKKSIVDDELNIDYSKRREKK